MANCDEQRNPLQRSGISQQQRLLPGLTPGYVKIDERRYSDWIVFAAEFSRYLKYYDPSTGANNSDWARFFTRDVSAVLGSIAVQNIETYRLEVKERLDYLKDNDNAANTADLKNRLSELFSAVFTLSKALDDYYLQLTDETTYKATLQNLIAVKLAPALWRLIAYYKAAKTLNFYVPVTDQSWRIASRPLTDSEILLTDTKGLSSIWWQTGFTSWILQVAGIPEDKSIFGQDTWPEEFRRISHAANHFLFATIFDQFTGVYNRLISEAEKSLAITLENWDSHPPHYALFLTFLKLFRTSQEHLNGLTWRHLDYYYKEILQLKPKEAIPDQVHLVAELAKQANSASLAEGTLFKAGKDSSGKEVVYALDQETTFNKAEVALFKGIYKGDAAGLDNWTDASDPSSPVTVQNENRLFAAPVMNSADGAGAELKTDFGEWHPLVNKNYNDDGELESIDMPPAEIGFAFASHYLFLSEGKRTILLRIDGNHVTALQNADLVCYLTTEKKWIEITPSLISSGTFSDSSACTEIKIEVPGTEPAITAYNAKVHGGTYNTDVPVVKCILKNELTGGNSYGYEALKNIAVSKTEVKVQVGTSGVYSQDGAKQLVMLNQNGGIDTSKPFQPWGAAPEKDMPLVIGNKELFTKKNASFNLHIEWANRPASFSPSPNATLQFLKGGIWSNASGASFTSSLVSSSATQKTFSSDVTTDQNSVLDYKDEYTDYNPSSQAGFMRIVLNSGFGHAAYLSALTIYLINKSKTPEVTPNPVPALPYTPVIKSIYLNYTAQSGVTLLTEKDEEDYSEKALSFFTVGAFGEAEQHTFLTGGTDHYLVPQYTSKDSEGNAVNNIAEWFIGIKNLSGNQSVNILFQLLEGTTNPLVSKPDEHVRWSYLANNQWVDFEDQQISDNTRQLIQSGIISFSLPEDASADNTILPADYCWIKAGVSQAADAVCKILSVHAQAMLATYKPDGNASDFLDNPLPAGTISKLKQADSSFKKIEQPYTSFGGRQTESSDQFYLRTSERLRHKGRAITIWDYEHLVLEAYPQLYKVKCLNHTQVKDDPNAALAVYNENQPGHVAVITIPSLVNRNDVNPLKPYTNQNLLSEIKTFLEERISGQVTVNTCNPLFEEIFLDFKLQLKEGYNDFTYYSNLLKEEITNYLSPWAYTSQAEVQFGGKIQKSSLINFIEERSYVDYITEVKMFHKPGESAPKSDDLEEAAATTGRSVLVSAAAIHHTIDPYVPDEEQEQYECEYLKNQSEASGNEL